MAYTISIDDINRAWLTEPVSGTSISCGTRTPSDETRVMTGEFRLLAGDRTQLAAQAAHTEIVPVVFVNVTSAVRNQIRAWAGVPLLLRLTDGRRFWGSFLETSEHRYLNTSVQYVSWDISVQFQVISYAEAV